MPQPKSLPHETIHPIPALRTDPRPELPGHSKWEVLLKLSITPDVWSALHAARCLGADLVYDPIRDRWVLQPPLDPQDAADYQDILRPKYLVPQGHEIQAALKKYAQALENGVPVL